MKSHCTWIWSVGWMCFLCIACSPVAESGWCNLPHRSLCRERARSGSIPVHGMGQDTTWSWHKWLVPDLRLPSSLIGNCIFSRASVPPRVLLCACLPLPLSGFMSWCVTQQMTTARPEPLRQGTGSVWGWRRVNIPPRGRGGFCITALKAPLSESCKQLQQIS